MTVTVSKPTLMISASTSVLNIGADPVDLMVTVSAAGDPTDITLTAMIDNGIVASVTPMLMTNVAAGTPTTFTVEGLAAGINTTMLTLMASHPDYISADITTITVNVTRPEAELRFRIKVFLEGAQ